MLKQTAIAAFVCTSIFFVGVAQAQQRAQQQSSRATMTSNLRKKLSERITMKVPGRSAVAWGAAAAGATALGIYQPDLVQLAIDTLNFSVEQVKAVGQHIVDHPVASVGFTAVGTLANAKVREVASKPFVYAGRALRWGARGIRDGAKGGLAIAVGIPEGKGEGTYYPDRAPQPAQGQSPQQQP